MSRRAGRGLTAQDRILWNQVARTVDPMPGRPVEPLDGEMEDLFRELAREADPPSSVPVAPAAAPAPGKTAPRSLDAPLRRKLARGRMPIESRIDLHGLTQAEAHGRLLAFLHQAFAHGRRNVLVVTGKGSSPGSEGALRRAVPHWLATPPFRGIVQGHDSASRRHGGEGAIYVRLRRPVET